MTARYAAPLALALALSLGLPLQAQVSFTGSYVEDFDGMGTAANAPLPPDWRADTQAAVRTLGTYAAAQTTTDQRGGNFFGPDEPFGIVNFGSGPEETASERAVGFATDTGGPGSGNIYLWIQNDTGAPLDVIYVADSREFYRGGAPEKETRSESFYSRDGANWIPDGGAGQTADGRRDGYEDAPSNGLSLGVAQIMLDPAVPVGGDLYLAFQFTAEVNGPGGLPTLALDNVALSVTGSFEEVWPQHGERVFGEVPVGQTSEAQVLLAYTQTFGSGVSDEATPQITGPHAGDFAVAPRFPDAGFPNDFEVTFTPSAPGLRTATLTFELDTATSRAVSLQGVGVSGGPSLSINEVLADPDDQDVNNDGTANTGDEFVELANTSGAALDVAGYQIADSDGQRYTFPPGTTLQDGEAAVIYGTAPGAFVDGGLPALSDFGENVSVYDAAGVLRLREAVPNGAIAPGISYARDPDFTGPFTLSTSINGLPYTPGTTNDGGTALPVELVAFRALTDGDRVRLTWETASEAGNAGFAVEMKRAASFAEVGFVAGAGTTEQTQSYRFQTGSLEPGTYTFRLRQVDLDGAFTYSPEVEATVGPEGPFMLTAVRPNPAATTAEFSLGVAAQQRVTVTVYDLLGRRLVTVFEGPLEASEAAAMTVPVQSLPAGVYLLHAEGERFATTRRFTVVR